MTALDPPVSTPQPSPAATLSRLTPALFAATLFLSALLLFAVQPMFTKMVLPRLGGAQSVWSVAMVFFQAALLTGYLYAHLVARAGQRRGALAHLALLALAALALPIGIAPGFGTPPQDGLPGWVLVVFAASVGLPFVALAASAPLLQSWFAASGHPQARNPYVLYAASNLGSFTALVAYPLAIEPWLRLGAQSAIWSAGFALLVLMIVAAALAATRGGPGTARVDPGAATTARERLRWTLLAAIPSGLVVSVTAYITTDIASAPLLWVVPLGLYLLTFVAVFRERPWLPHRLVVSLVPIALAPLAVSVLGGDKKYWFATILLNLVAFILLALMCHGQLYRSRPQPARLTAFYLWVSFGGVVGGALCGLVAPQVLTGTYEYPILLIAAVLALPGTFAPGVPAFMRALLPWAVLVGLTAAVALAFDVRVPAQADGLFRAALVILAGVMLWQRERRAAFLGVMALALVLSELWQPGVRRVESARSFFGTHVVAETADRQFRQLMHGTTIHGTERVRHPDGSPVNGRPEPLMYYYFGGPLSEAIGAQRARGLARAAVVGLGAGSLACHGREGEHWHFFEIDPEVVRIARDERLFRFLSACGPDMPITLGDARLTLAASPQRYDLIVLDAFSSDAIPVHLLTREAFAGYLARLSPRGTIVVHISNRHMELARVVAAVGGSHGLVTLARQDSAIAPGDATQRANAHVAVLAREAGHLAALAGASGWRRIDADPDVPPWTDDYANVLGAILRFKGWM